MTTNIMSDEIMKAKDNGALSSLLKHPNKFFCVMNTFPYKNREIDEDTFNHFMQYCKPDGFFDENTGITIYEAKHFSEI